MSKDKVSLRTGNIGEKAIAQIGSNQNLSLTNYEINVQNVHDANKILDEIKKDKLVKKPIRFRGESSNFVGRKEDVLL